MYIWKRSDVDEAATYRIALIQLPNGHRNFSLVSADSDSLPQYCALLTEIVPTDLLLRRNLNEISGAVRLTNGQSFLVDAHGVWFVQAEIDALMRDQPIPWLNGIPALLAPQ